MKSEKVELSPKCEEHIYNLTNEFYRESLKQSLLTACPALTDGEYKKLVGSDLQFDLEEFEINSFVRTACELSHISRMYIDYPNGFRYEPKLNQASEEHKGKNVDLSFLIEGVRFNVEVKCLTPKAEATDKVSLTALVPATSDKLEIDRNENVELVRSALLNVNDFIRSANDKFGTPNDKEYNILSICCYDLPRMIEVLESIAGDFGIAFNRNRGFLSCQKNLDSDSFKKIDAIVINNISYLHFEYSKEETELFLNPFDLLKSVTIGCMLHENGRLDGDDAVLFKKAFNLHNDAYLAFCKAKSLEPSGHVMSFTEYVKFINEQGYTCF
ncbi:hypothetical protein ACI45T_004616 [Vibrio vulnificus]|nr:hypothetical protein [Vibrio vulnificus]